MTGKTLDEQIRAKAKAEASAAFHKQFQELFKWGHAGTWTTVFGYEKYKELIALRDLYLNEIVIPKAEQDAVNSFYATYQNLLQEFPNLVVETAQEQQS
jgi:hypothetical protein